jgi:hypothetical protein
MSTKRTTDELIEVLSRELSVSVLIYPWCDGWVVSLREPGGGALMSGAQAAAGETIHESLQQLYDDLESRFGRPL